MSEHHRRAAADRLRAIPGMSVCISYGAHPEEVLAGREHLSIQTSGYTEVNLDVVLPILRDLSGTFDLEFIGPVTDHDLRHLAGLQNLLTLELSHRQITDVGLVHIAGLTSLRKLELRELPITAAGAGHLASLTNLRELALSGTQVDDSGVDVLLGLAELTNLDLSRCPVTDRGLKSLSRLTKLESVDLSASRIEGPGLAHLEALTNLQSLRLNLVPIGDRDASFLARLTNLRSLSLHGTRVGDEGARWLAQLRDLRWLYSLDLSKTEIKDDGLRYLESGECLSHISLSGTEISGAGLARLPKNIDSLGLTGIDLKEDDFAGLDHLENLLSVFFDEKLVTDRLVERLRRKHLGRGTTFGEGVAAFGKLPACPLCQQVIDKDDPVFVARPFGMAPEFYSLVKMPIHWDCYARWERRSEFARQYFRANVVNTEHNQFWGVARSDDTVLLSVNPSQYVKEIEVVLAQSGSSFRIPLDDWENWLEGEWFESCHHKVEREALACLIPSFREDFPTAEALVEAAGLSPGDTPAELEGTVGLVSYEFACQDLAKRAAEKGLACPRCGEFSNEYEFRKVKVIDADGARSVLICKSCEGEFGPDDV
jgi:Leucine Rich repeat